MTITCPIDNGEAVCLERIAMSSLVRAYRGTYGIDVSSCMEGHSEIGLYHCPSCDLRFFHPPLSGSERFYEQLQQFDWYYLSEKSEYETARRFIRPGDDVLEVGCGRGAFAKLIDAASYTGLEFSAMAREAAEKEGLRVLTEPVEAHAQEHRGKYDAVCTFQVLEHVADPRSFLDACVSCLKPGGLLIVSVPSEDSFVSADRNNILNMPPHHLTRWTDQALGNLAPLFGLEVVALEHERLSDLHLPSYASLVARGALRQALGMKPPRLERTLTDRLIALVSEKLGNFLAKGLKAQTLRPYGHSVTVVYSKGEGEGKG